VSDIVMGNVVLNFKAKLDELKQARTGFDALQQDVIALNQALDLVKRGYEAMKNVFGGLLIESARAQQSHNMLRNTLQLLGIGTDETFKKMQNFASEMQGITGISDEIVIDMQRIALQFGVTEERMDGVVRQALGLSKTLGVDTTTALRLVTEAAEGNIERLQRYVPAMKNATTEVEKQTIANKFLNDSWNILEKSQEDNMTNIDRMKESWGDFREKLGDIISVYLVPLIKKFTELIQSLSDTQIKVYGLGAVILTLSATGIPAIKGLITIFGSLKTVMLGVFTPAGVVGVAIAGILALVTAVFNQIKGIVDEYKAIKSDDKATQIAAQAREAAGRFSSSYGKTDFSRIGSEEDKKFLTELLKKSDSGDTKASENLMTALKFRLEESDGFFNKDAGEGKYTLELLNKYLTNAGDFNRALRDEVVRANINKEKDTSQTTPTITQSSMITTQDTQIARDEELEAQNQFEMDMHNIELKWNQARIDAKWEQDTRAEEANKRRMQEQQDWTANMLMSSWQGISSGVGAIFEDMFRLDKAKKSLLEYLKMFGMAMKEAIVKALRAYEIQALGAALTKGFAAIPEMLWITIKYEALAGALSAIRFAEGGVVDRPTLALLGEAGQREFVTPEITFENKFNDLAAKLLGKVGGNNYTINYVAPASLSSHEEAAKEIIPRVSEYLSNYAGDSL